MDNKELKKDQMKKGCYVYLRVSSDEQVTNFSLDSQLEQCQAEAQRKGLEVMGIFREEGRSAKNITERPELLRMLDEAKKNQHQIKSVVIYRIDRISRQTSDYLAIRTKLATCGISLISTSEPTGSSPTEKFVETLLASVAELDNSIKAERSRNGLQRRFLSGLPHGGWPPLGYKKGPGKIWEKDPDIWDTMISNWNLMATGTKSLKEMSDHMNDQGLRIRTTRGGERLCKIRPQTVSRIFANKIYCGIISYPSMAEETQSVLPAMVDLKTFYRVQNIISGRTVVPLNVKRIIDRNDLPLRRIVRCSKCGSGLTGAWSRGKAKSYSYYMCSKHHAHGSIPSGELERVLLEKLENTKPSADCLRMFKLVILDKWQEKITKLKERQANALKEVESIKNMRLSIAEKFASNAMAEDIYKEMDEKLKDTMMVKTLIGNENLISKFEMEEHLNFLISLFSDLPNAYSTGNVHQKRELLCSIWPSGMVWEYPGLSNTQISPVFETIKSFEKAYTPKFLQLGAESASCIEHFLEWIRPLTTAFPNYKLSFAYSQPNV